MKILCAKFLPDFQNVDTQIFKKASCFQKKYIRKCQVGVKMSKNDKKRKILVKKNQNEKLQFILGTLNHPPNLKKYYF